MNPEKIFAFLKELNKNNNKEWFEKNKKIYEEVKQEYHQIAFHLIQSLQKMDDSLKGLEVKNCTFRINKDIRFSKDKTPYKTSLGIVLTPYGKKMSLAAYYVHLEDGKNFVGGGLYMPPNDMVKKVRQEIVTFQDEFANIINNKKFTSVYGDLEKSPEIMLSKVPKDINVNSNMDDYVRLKSYTTGKPYSNEMVISKDFIKNATNDLLAMKDFIHFINKGLMTDENGATMYISQ
jgi:uncharacterized protein (TIGR02453 family)